MKKLLFIAIAISLIFTALTLPAHAQQKTPTTSVLPSNETIDHDYFATGDTVEISGTVNNDTYAAGGSITVDGVINGDLLAAGGNLLITGDITQDVRIAGGNITFSGAQVGGSITVMGGQITIDNGTSVGGSIVSTGGNIQILAPITEGITVAGGNVVIGNSVGGDITAAVGELSLVNNANVNGDITYWSDRQANVSDAATVSGTITQKMRTDNVDKEAAAAGLAGFIFFVRLMDTLLLLVIGLITLSLLPIYSTRITNYIIDRIGMSLLIGLVTIIVIPVLIAILMITLIGIPLGLFLLVLFLAMMWFVRIFAINALGNFILTKTNNKRGMRWGFIVGIIIYFILGLLPVISMLTDIILVLAGTGAFIAAKKQYYTELRTKKLI